MAGLGTIVNVVTVLGGTVIGVVLGHRLSERLRVTVLQGVGLITVVNGMLEAQETRNLVFPLVAIVAGAVIGEGLRIEERLEGLGDRLHRVFARDGEESRFVEGFVAASLIFCVGPLTILGSIQDGLNHDAHLLILKASLDGLVAVVFASTLGWGVGASVVVIGVYQGALTALGGVLDAALTHRMVLELTATGGIMIIAIGVRLLDLRKIRVASFLPGLVVAPIAVALFAR
jgi:uncharacterized membrane protein YqgA involved in biofilm formation